MNVKKSLTLAVLVTALSLGGFVASASATPITITNGSFEVGDPAGLGSFETLYSTNSTSTHISGWTVSDGSVDYIGAYWTAQNGVRSLDMNGIGIGTIQQQITVPTAGNVSINFWMAGNPDNAPNVKTLKVSLISADQFFTFDITGHTRGAMGWENRTAVFSGISVGLWTLAFEGDPTATNYGPALDNISASVTVPDGGMTASLLGLGLTGLGLIRRRFRA